MSKILSLIFPLLIFQSLSAQDINTLINQKEVDRVERKLSSDDMEGRAAFTKGIEKSAEFISGEFKKAGLSTWDTSKSYLQPFTVIKLKPLNVTAELDGRPLSEKQIAVFTAQTELSISNSSGYKKVYIKQGDIFVDKLLKYLQRDKNYLVIVDTSFARNLERFKSFVLQQFKSPNNAIFVLTPTDPKTYTVHYSQQIVDSKFTNNIVGVLPGRSKKNEYVIFSGHYDHLGIGAPDEKRDSVFNGANDDASGVTAVIMLANYFAKLNNNERTILFIAFTAEEVGGYGSQYFSKHVDPSKVMAMFNIEMIGTESKWGMNSVYLTGYEKTDMGKILEKNLSATQFKIYPDPYTSQHLFYRSDNATLARNGVPAHTISTSKMNSEKYYHTPDDEIETLDLKNMTEIIKAIAISSRSIVDGKDTPSRVAPE